MDVKIQLESIADDVNSSFHLMFNPKLNDLFYWHFHPEYELVYIDGATGTRHVGDHISGYEGSDMVLIGSNIPHLNFDYGVMTEYNKVVVHIKPSFVETHISKIPELNDVARLFEKSLHGIVFDHKDKKEIGRRLFELKDLNPFELYLEVIKILKLLATTNSQKLLHDRPYINQYSIKEQERLRKIHAYVDQNYHRKIELVEVANHADMSKEAFCRFFKKVSGNTFVNFLNQYRISQSKRLLMRGESVSEACYSCGFESLSYFSRVFKKMTGNKPSDFKKR